MPIVIRAAPLTFDASGAPFSPDFRDIYHSADSGPGQARHVFLHGNDLPARWRGTRVFAIVETGFGSGLNFLATWSAWRADPERCLRLHFVSIEKHPFRRDDLAALHAHYPQFASLAAELRSMWPPLLPGTHRLEFEDGRVVLTLAFADVYDALRGMRLAADAFYLDGFAPDRNPEMWTLPVMKAIARLSAPGATLATYTTARTVRDALSAAGFGVEKRPGFGRKREMLRARFAPRWTVRSPPPAAPQWPERRAIVVGAGLAGAAVAERLAMRGWRIDLIERQSTPAAQGSGLHAGAFHPNVSRDDSALSRLARAGFLYALARWRSLEAAGHPLAWQCCGALQVAEDAAHEARMADTLAALGYPSDYAQYVTRDAGGELAGRGVAAGGWWFPAAGWMRPSSLVEAQLSACARASPGSARTDFRFGREVARLTRIGALWRAQDAAGAAIAEAPVVVLANAHDAARLVEIGPGSLRRVRGQVSYLPAPPFASPRTVVCGAGYVLPAIDGIAVAGATYDLDDDDPRPNAAGHAGNLARLERMLVGSGAGLDPAALQGSTGFRCVAIDRLPLAGAIVDVTQARLRAAGLAGAQAADLPRLPGMYGAFAYASRGLGWAALAAELIASQLDGEPPPLPRDLADAIDPGRFLLKRARRGAL